ncbi:MAG TPA: M64 family metallopeptidase [Phycisphaerae bacterium]|nr:M64 family metallopeptidase [Phycisphaerae bacterium]
MKPGTIIAMLILATNTVAGGAVNVELQPDGHYYTGVLVHGTTAAKYDIVFIGDGFTASQQNTFNNAVNDAVAALQARAPYGDRMCGFNIWRVNVISTESGIDHPMESIFRDTELGCRYGNTAVGEAERCITSDTPAKCFEAAGHAPDYDAVFVLCNDTQWGGCAGSLVFSSISSGFAGIITHELGHKLGALADEYTCYVCDGSDSNLTYTGAEPTKVNLTKQTAFAAIKWNSFMDPATPLPTTVDSPAGVVGIWEGGGYHRYGIYRPQAHCHMLDGSAFCAVCNDELFHRLSSRCTPCEINPTGFVCLYGDLLKRLKFLYARKPFWRWPIPPPCLSCGFVDVLDQGNVLLEIAGLPDGFILQVFDDQGNLVATNNALVRKGQAMVSFQARGDRQYFAELSSGVEAVPTGEELNLSITLTRNQVQQPLPGGG